MLRFRLWPGTLKDNHQSCSPPLTGGDLNSTARFLMALQNACTWDGPCFHGVLELLYSTMAVCSVIWFYIEWLIMCQEFYYGQQILFNQQQRPNSHCWTSVLRAVLDDSRHARWDLPRSLCSMWATSMWMGCRFPHQLCWAGAGFRPS